MHDELIKITHISQMDFPISRINGNINHKICTEKRINTSLKDISIALNNHGRHCLLLFSSSLPISISRILELEAYS